MSFDDVTCACTKSSIGISGCHSNIPLKEVRVLATCHVLKVVTP